MFQGHLKVTLEDCFMFSGNRNCLGTLGSIFSMRLTVQLIPYRGFFISTPSWWLYQGRVGKILLSEGVVNLLGCKRKKIAANP